MKPNVKHGGKKEKFVWDWSEPQFSELLLYAQKTFYWWVFCVFFTFCFVAHFCHRSEEKTRETLEPVLKKRKEAGKKSKSQARLNYFPLPVEQPQFDSKRLKNAVEVVRQKAKKKKEVKK